MATALTGATIDSVEYRYDGRSVRFISGAAVHFLQPSLTPVEVENPQRAMRQEIELTIPAKDTTSENFDTVRTALAALKDKPTFTYDDGIISKTVYVVEGGYAESWDSGDSMLVSVTLTMREFNQ